MLAYFAITNYENITLMFIQHISDTAGKFCTTRTLNRTKTNVTNANLETKNKNITRLSMKTYV